MKKLKRLFITLVAVLMVLTYAPTKVSADEYVAEITNTSGTTYYTSAQDALDAANSGDKVILYAGNHGTLYVRQVQGKSLVVDVTHQEGEYGPNDLYLALNGVTIEGQTGAIVNQLVFEAGYYSAAESSWGSNWNRIIDSVMEIDNFTIKNITFNLNGNDAAIKIKNSSIRVTGLTVDGCTVNGTGYYGDSERLIYNTLASKNYVSENRESVYGEIQKYDVNFTSGLKNFVVKDCTFNNLHQVAEIRNTENVTFTGNNVNNVKLQTLLLTPNTGDAVSISGNLVISDNVIIDGTDGQRAFRLSKVDANVTFSNNTVTNHKNNEDIGNGEIAKADNSGENATYTLNGNNWMGENDAQAIASKKVFIDKNPTIISYVAQIGSTKYETLQQAVNAAVTQSQTNNEAVTVTLLKDVTNGTGIALFNSAKGTYPAASTANVVIDFATHTYTVAEPAVGSTGTENQMLHFEEGNTVTLRNGTLKVTTDTAKLDNFKMIMQNYCGLTIENMTIDGTGIPTKVYGDSYKEPWKGTEAPKFNYNTAGTSVIRNSTIIVPGDMGIDDNTNLTIEDDAIIKVNKIVTKGTDSRYSFVNPTIVIENGAKFTDAGVATILAEDQKLSEIDENNLYTVQAKDYVAQIGSTKYESLADAIAAVPTTGAKTTIKMLDNSTENGNIEIAAQKNIELDLNGYAVSAVASGNGWALIRNYGTLTIEDNSTGGTGRITSSGTVSGGELATIYNLGGTLTLNSGTIDYTGNYYISYAVSNSSNAWGKNDDKETVFNMYGGTLSVPNGDQALRVYQNCAATPTPYSHNIVNITGGTIADSGIFVDTYIYNPSGNTTGSGILVDINISGGEIHGLIDMKLRHPYNTSLDITGGTFVDSKLWVRKHSEWNAVTPEPTSPLVNISGGQWSFLTGKAFGLAYDCGTTSWATYSKPYYVSGGVYNVDLNNNYSGIEFPQYKTGVANTDSKTKDAYPYTVGDAVTYVAQIGGTSGPKYETLDAAYAAAQAGDTIVLLDDITFGTDRSVAVWSKAVNLDLGGHTLTTNSTVDTTLGNNGYKAAAICYSIPAASAASVTVTNGTIVTAYGAGVYADDPGLTLTLENLTINANTVGVQTTAEYSSAVRITGGAKVIINSGAYNGENAIAVSNSGGEFEIDGGSFKGKLYISSTCDVGKTQKITIEGGKFSNDPTAYVAEGYKKVAISEDGLYYQVVAEPVAKIGDVEYTSLDAAYAAAKAGDTIVLLDDIDLTATVVINKNLTIDLAEYDIVATNARALWIKSGDVTITGTGTISASGNGLAADSSVIRVGDGSANAAKAKLTVDENVTVRSDKSYVITVFGVNNDSNSETTDIELVVNGSVVSTVASGTAADAAISGNGNSGLSATSMTINGSVTSTNTYAIYHPGKGTLNINGTVTGLGGIEMKSGTITTVGASAHITATASSITHSLNNNGPSTSGYALAVVENSGYYGQTSVTIENGYIKGEIARVVDNVVAEGKSGSITITGGKFSISPASYLGTGYTVIDNTDDDKATYPYTVDEVHTHTYDHTKEPTWSWKVINGEYAAFATFTCVNGDATERVPATVEQTGDYHNQRVYTATVELENDIVYTSTKEDTYKYDVKLYNGYDYDVHGQYMWGDICTIDKGYQNYSKWYILNNPDATPTDSDLVADGISTYAFAVTGDTYLRTEASSKTEEVAVVKATMVSGTSGNATFNAKWSIPEGYVIENVVIYRGYTTENKTITAATLESKGTSYEAQLNTRHGDFTLNLYNLTPTRYQHAVIVITYRALGAEESQKLVSNVTTVLPNGGNN